MDKPFWRLVEEDKNLILYGSDRQGIPFHYENEFGGCAISTFLLRELSIISNVVTMRLIVTHAPRCASTWMSWPAEPAMAIVSMTRPCLSVWVVSKGHISVKSQICLSQTTWLLVSQLTLSENEAIIARPILKEIKDRLTFLNNVGLNYLTLSRSAGTLSGGEKSAYSFGNPDWFQPIRCPLYPGWAVDWSSPEG